MSNPLYSIGTRIVDEEGKAERRVIQLTDSSIIVGPDLTIKGTVNCEKAVICGNTLGVSDNATLAKDLTVNGTTTLETTNIKNLTVSSSTSLSGISSLSTSGSLTVGGTATINGNATFEGSINNSGTPRGTGLSTKRINLSAATTYQDEGLFVWSNRLINGSCDVYSKNGLLGWFVLWNWLDNNNQKYKLDVWHSPNLNITTTEMSSFKCDACTDVSFESSHQLPDYWGSALTYLIWAYHQSDNAGTTTIEWEFDMTHNLITPIYGYSTTNHDGYWRYICLLVST